jgi:2-haloacid dehalogenase
MVTTPQPRLITFDVYTALFDVESGVSAAIRETCGEGVDALPLARAWRAKQLEYAQVSNSLQRGRIPFRVITRRSMDYTFARAGVSLSTEQREALAQAWDRLPPWPEARATLLELRGRGYSLGLLSNGDEEMLRALARAMGVDFDAVLASDHAGHYKPHPSMYLLPRQRLGLADADVLHVAGSSTDVLGCKSAGLACAWSNRNGDAMLDPDVRADHEMRDLTGLLPLLAKRVR